MQYGQVGIVHVIPVTSYNAKLVPEGSFTLSTEARIGVVVMISCYGVPLEATSIQKRIWPAKTIFNGPFQFQLYREKFQHFPASSIRTLQ
jgi:hypothetical protein